LQRRYLALQDTDSGRVFFALFVEILKFLEGRVVANGCFLELLCEFTVLLFYFLKLKALLCFVIAVNIISLFVLILHLLIVELNQLVFGCEIFADFLDVLRERVLSFSHRSELFFEVELLKFERVLILLSELR
jgi:hypothetical protein